MTASPALAIDDVAAAVLLPGVLVVAGGARLLLAVAHGVHLRLAHAEDVHHLHHGVGAALAEGEVVLAAAALVGVALDPDLGLRVGAQVARVRLDDAAVPGADLVLVESVVDAALGGGALARRGVRGSGDARGPGRARRRLRGRAARARGRRRAGLVARGFARAARDGEGDEHGEEQGTAEEEYVSHGVLPRMNRMEQG